MSRSADPNDHPSQSGATRQRRQGRRWRWSGRRIKRVGGSTRSSIARRTTATIIGALSATLIAMVSGGSLNPQTRGTGALPVFISIAVVLVALVGASVFFRSRSKQKQHTDKDDSLDKLGLTRRKGEEKATKRRFGKLSELRGGSINEVFEGALADRELVVFTHVRMIYTGNATVPIYRTIYAVATPAWLWVNITPSRPWSRWLGKLFGRRSFRLDLPEFNRRFRVTAHDEDFALTLLCPELQRHILDKPNVTWRLVDGWLCLVYNGRIRLDRAAGSIGRLEMFLNLIPPELASWESAQ